MKSLGCMLCLAAAAAAAPLDNDSIKTAVAAWLSDSAAAEVTYGHITSWDTSQVTDMSSLFCAHHSLSSCNTAALSFNEDNGTWDTSGVTSMYAMFGSNEGFNRDLSDWAVDSVTDMSHMFSYATSFNQDLGWCVDDGVNLDYAFSSTLCESTSCGVTQGSSSQTSNDDDVVDDDKKMTLIVLACLIGLSLVLIALRQGSLAELACDIGMMV